MHFLERKYKTKNHLNILNEDERKKCDKNLHEQSHNPSGNDIESDNDDWNENDETIEAMKHGGNKLAELNGLVNLLLVDFLRDALVDHTG